MIFKDYYKILGLKNNKVNIEEIKQAFHSQAKKYHPDVNENQEAEERFKDINEAYRTLSNSSAKRKYDRIWYSHVGKKIEKQKDKEERESKTDLWSLLFGANKVERKIKKESKIPEKGENVETQINVGIKQAFYGTNQKISLRTVEGKMKTFDVKIPSGIRNGEKIRLIGQGKQGQNGGKNGDLLIKVNIQNSNIYKLYGYDIYTDLLITPWEAVLGTRAQIETIDGESKIYVPQGVESGEEIKIPQKGYKNGKGGRGDLIAKIKIVVPKKPTKEEMEIYEKLKNISKFEPRNRTTIA
jgi:chaperone dnaJ domain protein